MFKGTNTFLKYFSCTPRKKNPSVILPRYLSIKGPALQRPISSVPNVAVVMRIDCSNLKRWNARETHCEHEKITRYEAPNAQCKRRGNGLGTQSESIGKWEEIPGGSERNEWINAGGKRMENR